jgi:hypothetical protein
MADHLEIPSRLHGVRTWTRVGSRAHLDAWQGHCVICGAPFEVLTRQRLAATAIAANHAFRVVTCRRHRLTRSEIGRLRRNQTSEAIAVFEEIRQRKLRCDDAGDADPNLGVALPHARPPAGLEALGR